MLPATVMPEILLWCSSNRTLERRRVVGNDPIDVGFAITSGRDIDRVYLDGVERRSRAMLHRLIEAMRSTQTTELKYLIQRVVPTFLSDMNRAHALRETL